MLSASAPHSSQKVGKQQPAASNRTRVQQPLATDVRSMLRSRWLYDFFASSRTTGPYAARVPSAACGQTAFATSRAK